MAIHGHSILFTIECTKYQFIRLYIIIHLYKSHILNVLSSRGCDLNIGISWLALFWTIKVCFPYFNLLSLLHLLSILRFIVGHSSTCITKNKRINDWTSLCWMISPTCAARVLSKLIWPLCRIIFGLLFYFLNKGIN